MPVSQFYFSPFPTNHPVHSGKGQAEGMSTGRSLLFSSDVMWIGFSLSQGGGETTQGCFSAEHRVHEQPQASAKTWMDGGWMGQMNFHVHPCTHLYRYRERKYYFHFSFVSPSRCIVWASALSCAKRCNLLCGGKKYRNLRGKESSRNWQATQVSKKIISWEGWENQRSHYHQDTEYCERTDSTELGAPGKDWPRTKASLTCLKGISNPKATVPENYRT